VAVSSTTYNTVKQAVNFSRETNGYFDPSIGPLADIWKTAIHSHTLPEKDAIVSARELVDWRQISLDDDLETVKLSTPGMKLDLGGIGKGYAFDLAKKVLENHHIQNALISCRSSLIAIGKNPQGKPWKIAIRNPRFTPNSAAERTGKENPYLGYVELTNQALSTSGDYEQFTQIGGKRYAHIIDPKTGYPVQGIECVVVISKSAALADAYSTAAFVMGVRDGLRLINYGTDTEGMIVDSSGKVYTSIGFKLLKE
jgi:thiamine biosynthesis lipoprotein